MPMYCGSGLDDVLAQSTVAPSRSSYGERSDGQHLRPGHTICRLLCEE
jgi:hypothetical protein